MTHCAHKEYDIAALEFRRVGVRRWVLTQLWVMPAMFALLLVIAAIVHPHGEYPYRLKVARGSVYAGFLYWLIAAASLPKRTPNLTGVEPTACTAELWSTDFCRHHALYGTAEPIIPALGPGPFTKAGRWAGGAIVGGVIILFGLAIWALFALQVTVVVHRLFRALFG